MSNDVGTKATDFVNFGITDVNAANEFGSIGTPATRVRRPTDESNWLPPGHLICEIAA